MAAFKAFTIEDIKKEVEKGYEVEISGFNIDEDKSSVFPCVLKKIDLLAWFVHGVVPNELRKRVEELFNITSGGTKPEDAVNDINAVAEHTQLMEWIAEQSMVSPKYGELVEEGIYLSQVQLYDIYVFQMQGVEALNSFRRFNVDAAPGVGIETVLESAVGNDGDTKRDV